jgi:flavin reductase (DIM6/NTAB) family NADH-FMN oxidoreductase RutF
MPIDTDLFRAVLGRFATGITVTTTRDAEGRDHGMTVSAFASLSLEPPLVLVCIANEATMATAMLACDTFAVNILSAKQEALSRRFAGKLRSFRRSALHPRHSATPFDDALASIECHVRARHPAGDHTIVIGEVHSGSARDARPLLYYRGGYAQLER